MASARALPRPPRALPARALVELAAALREAGYREASVALALGVPGLGEGQWGRSALYAAELERTAPAAQDALCQLLLLERPVLRAAVQEAIGAGALATLEDTGLVARGGKRDRDAVGGEALRALAHLFPAEGCLLATDLRSRRPSRGGAQPVMYLGGDSYALARAIPRREGGRVLDLCTGSGVQAIVACTRGAASALGTDQNPRAVAFARFNAALNGVEDRCRFEQADLDATAAPGERFDLVLCNPPFVPGAGGAGARVWYRDGGPTGDRVLARVVGLAGGRLRPGGLALIVSVFCTLSDQSLAARLERWRAPRDDVGMLLLGVGSESPAVYAYAQAVGEAKAGAGGGGGADRELSRWRRALERAKIQRVTGGILAIGPHPGPTPPWFCQLEAASPRGLDEHTFPRLFAGAGRARCAVFLEELLAASVRVPADVTETVERPMGGGSAGSSLRVRAAGLPLPPVACTEAVLGLLRSAVQGGALQAALGRAAEALGRSTPDLQSEVIRTVPALLERGLLEVTLD